MAFDDNRQFIEALAGTGDLVRVKKEVDWDMEAPAIVRRSNELGGPAVLFERVKDYPPGFRLFGGPLATYRRLAIALGLAPQISVQDMQASYYRISQRSIRPVVVKDAPCKDKILLGDKVDLYQFPAPMVHEGDGGRYIGTWHLVVSQEPGTDWMNWGMYRMMIYNRNHIAGGVSWTTDAGAIFLDHYLPNKKPMPLAIAIGADPLSCVAAATKLGRGMREADYAGGLRGKPVELVKCETNDLLVPAHAEIVLEAEMLPSITVLEGPFGEFPGYRHGMPLRHLIRVKAVTYRSDPILTMSNMGMPAHEDLVCRSISAAVLIKQTLLEKGIEVVDVNIPLETCNHLIIVAVKKLQPSMLGLIDEVVGIHRLGEHKLMVVDNDIDIFNLSQVFHAFATKCHPVRGLKVIEHGRCNPLTPFLSREERQQNKGARVVFDCTWPSDWAVDEDIPPRASFNDMYPREMKEKILHNWKSYGFR